jgi:hypothetical protein
VTFGLGGAAGSPRALPTEPAVVGLGSVVAVQCLVLLLLVGYLASVREGWEDEGAPCSLRAIRCNPFSPALETKTPPRGRGEARKLVFVFVFFLKVHRHALSASFRFLELYRLG